MELGLKDKRVLITASVRGIGRACAESFLREGARVWINGRDQGHIEEAREELETEFGEGRVSCFVGDASREEVIQAWIRSAERQWGAIDVLIPNLGSGKPVGSDRMDIHEWEHMMNINVYSAVRLISGALRLLKQGVHPCVILTASIAGCEKVGAPVAYAAAKASLLAMVKYWSDSCAADQIRVNGVAPGNIYFEGGRWEELLREDQDGVRKFIESQVPLRRFGTPGEIADAVTFLASERSLFTTGASLTVDGGQKRGW